MFGRMVYTLSSFQVVSDYSSVLLSIAAAVTRIIMLTENKISMEEIETVARKYRRCYPRQYFQRHLLCAIYIWCLKLATLDNSVIFHFVLQSLLCFLDAVAAAAVDKRRGLIFCCS